MAFRIIWSDEANTDFKEVLNYIKRDSLHFAKIFAEKIIKATHNLEDFPMIGRIVPEIKSDKIREIFVNQYRIIYKIDDSQIMILGLVHGRRDLTALWEDKEI